MCMHGSAVHHCHIRYHSGDRVMQHYANTQVLHVHAGFASVLLCPHAQDLHPGNSLPGHLTFDLQLQVQTCNYSVVVVVLNWFSEHHLLVYSF